jgi:hypothetical protein
MINPNEVRESVLASLREADKQNVVDGYAAGRYSDEDIKTAILLASRRQHAGFDPEKNNNDLLTFNLVREQIRKTYQAPQLGMLASKATQEELDALKDIPGSVVDNAKVPKRKRTPFD